MIESIERRREGTAKVNEGVGISKEPGKNIRTLPFYLSSSSRFSAMQSNYMLSGDPLSLDRIRSVLTRLEDTIIFGLIERAQFAHNPKIYQKGGFEELRQLDFKGSWLEWFLAEIEAFHGTFVKLEHTCQPPVFRYTGIPPLFVLLITFVRHNCFFFQRRRGGIPGENLIGCSGNCSGC